MNISKLIRVSKLLFGAATAVPVRAPAVIIPRGRAKTRDVAFAYRMGAGFPGDVNRTHPCSVIPAAIDPLSAVIYYGRAVVIDSVTHKVRAVVAGDSGLAGIYGIAARPFPVQVATATDYGAEGFAGGIAPARQPLDVLEWGYIMVAVGGDPVKGTPAYVWSAAAAGDDLPGQFTIDTTAGSTIGPLAKSFFNGGPDANGVTELRFMDSVGSG